MAATIYWLRAIISQYIVEVNLLILIYVEIIKLLTFELEES